ncbi:hypothetical protein DIPPA_25821 [Diplonema papillatum]|nr:hypothetical protein DIPPA_25821 [Diplonema papillatum]
MPAKKKEEEPVSEEAAAPVYLERIRENVRAREDGELLCSEIMEGVVRRTKRSRTTSTGRLSPIRTAVPKHSDPFSQFF